MCSPRTDLLAPAFVKSPQIGYMESINLVMDVVIIIAAATVSKPLYFVPSTWPTDLPEPSLLHGIERMFLSLPASYVLSKKGASPTQRASPPVRVQESISDASGTKLPSRTFAVRRLCAADH